MYSVHYVCIFILLRIASAADQMVSFKRTPQKIVNDEFMMCFGAGENECIELSRPLYEYYIRSNSALINNEPVPVTQEDHTGLRHTVDSLMFEFLNGEELEDSTCIPYVSSYTDCTRENICTGCQTCRCDASANWKCEITMRCVPESKLVINTKVLQKVLDVLSIDDEAANIRTKRESKLIPHVIDYGLFVNWLYDKERRFSGANPLNNTNTDNKTMYNDPAFNQFLNSITRKKEIEYDSTKKISTKPGNATVEILEKQSDATISDPVDKVSNFIIDLLDPNNDWLANRLQDQKLVKRDTPVKSEIEFTDSIKKLKEEILYPITSVIDSKQKEIDELLKIRKKLIQILIEHKNLDTKQLNSTEQNTESPYVSIYKIEILPDDPDVDTEFRRTNSSALVDKYFTKLKRDIYEVIKDIVGIQKYSDIKKLPEDLKILIRAMRYYVRHQDELLFNGHKSKIPKKKVLRQFSHENKIGTTYMKENLKKIIEAVRDTPIPDAIDNLSPATYKIVKRLIKHNYNEVYGDDFNLTIDVKDVGTHWNQIMKDAENASPLEKLTFMKLLYVILISDMNKVNHAMHVLEFAKNRRMRIDGNMVPLLAKRINLGLTTISGRLDQMIKQNEKSSDSQVQYLLSSPSPPHPQVNDPPQLINIHGLTEHNSGKKDSMLQHIKDMLKTSKHAIVNMIRRKVPKSEIIKSIAKKKFGILSREQHLQDVMITWQKNLNVTSSRTKRSTRKHNKKNKKTNTSPKRRNNPKRKAPTRRVFKRNVTKKVLKKVTKNKPKTVTQKTVTAKQNHFKETKISPLVTKANHSEDNNEKNHPHRIAKLTKGTITNPSSVILTKLKTKRKNIEPYLWHKSNDYTIVL